MMTYIVRTRTSPVHAVPTPVRPRRTPVQAVPLESNVLACGRISRGRKLLTVARRSRLLPLGGHEGLLELWT